MISTGQFHSSRSRNQNVLVSSSVLFVLTMLCWWVVDRLDRLEVIAPEQLGQERLKVLLLSLARSAELLSDIRDIHT